MYEVYGLCVEVKCGKEFKVGRPMQTRKKEKAQQAGAGSGKLSLIERLAGERQG